MVLSNEFIGLCKSFFTPGESDGNMKDVNSLLISTAINKNMFI